MQLSPSLEQQLAPDPVTRSMIIIEDEAVVSLMIEMVAGDLGWRIAGTAYNEPAALELLKTVSPSVAVIDIRLGATSGFGVSAACHARGVPVLFVTGLSRDNVPAECGDDQILAKPFSVEEFERALSRYAKRG